MSEYLHLPECWATYPSDPLAWCICDELRACTERVISEGDEQSQIAYTTGYRRALDAAERSVAAIPVHRWPYSEPHDPYVETITVESALAAITALRKGPND
jgi:hypothetical protein